MTELRLSPDLALPLQAVTYTHGLLAMRGAGKSNAAVVMAEQMDHAGLQWAAIDPKGDWWGIRSSADGRHEGLAVPILGGAHGDVPLGAGEGQQWADVIVNERLTCVLDLSEMTKGEQTRFLVDFAERLFRLKLSQRSPMHLFLDEADDYIPQRVPANQARVVGAFSRIVKQGRNRGIGITMATQRSAVLNKDVLTQLDTLIALRTTAKLDRTAILGWVETHALGKELVDALPALDDGEAWVWSPHAYKVMKKIRFDRRATFDSGATPTVGVDLTPPSRLADVDLAAIKEQMAETIERAKADDPKELRKRVAELERELRAAQDAVRSAHSAPAEQVPYVPVEVIELVERSVEMGDATIEVLRTATELRDALATLVTAGDGFGAITDRIQTIVDGGAVKSIERTPPRTPVRTEPAPKPAATQVSAPRRVDTAAANGNAKIGKAERAVLAALVQKPDADSNQLAILAGYHKRSKSYTNALGAMRTAGLLDGIRLTAAGEALAAELRIEPIADLWDHWYNHPKVDGAGRKILDVLAAAGPGSIDKATLAEGCGYHERSKSFTNALSRLRTLELITRGADIRLMDEFADALS